MEPRLMTWKTMTEWQKFFLVLGILWLFAMIVTSLAAVVYLVLFHLLGLSCSFKFC